MMDDEVSNVYALGTVLRKMGKVERTDVRRALETQRAGDGETRLGEILIRTGNLSKEDLELALEAQRLLRSRSKRDQTEGAVKLADLSSRSVMDLTVSVGAEADRKTAGLHVMVGGKRGD